MKNMEETPKPPSPKRIVNLISGGEEVNGVTYTSAKKLAKVSVIHEKRTWQTLTGESVTFNDEDTDGLFIPYNDALVITLHFYDINTERVLIDPESLANIIQL